MDRVRGRHRQLREIPAGRAKDVLVVYVGVSLREVAAAAPEDSREARDAQAQGVVVEAVEAGANHAAEELLWLRGYTLVVEVKEGRAP